MTLLIFFVRKLNRNYVLGLKIELGCTISNDYSLLLGYFK